MHTIFFDLETGGLDLRHPIIQLAAVAVDADLKEVSSFERKVHFVEAEAEPEALKMNHYDPEVWAQSAIAPPQLVREFTTWLKRFADVQMVSKRTGNPYSVAQLAGYNAATFDGPRLQKLFRDAAAFLPAHPRVLDVLQLVLWDAFKRRETHESYRLSEVYQRLGYTVDGAHDALFDVRATVQVVRDLKQRGGTQ